ncbi:hypothetical protein BC939DRAFT_433843, partial [Gamsiella multidivaricata]|uniref:uncharacterized protein n=1 Tax=Gamsiella multidivaricata TaxID=101098 RepID=UPI00221FB69D
MYSGNILIICAAVLGSLLLIVALILFYVCMKRRRAAHRIGHLQGFLPTFMDEKAADEYFKKQVTALPSASTFVPPPSSVHHRMRSEPADFTKGECVDRTNNNNRSDSSEQFQQILLTEGTYSESDDEIALKGSLLSASRTRATTITIPTITLHRSVSLNHHRNLGYTSRSAPMNEESAQDSQDTDPLPTSVKIRFADGQAPTRSSISKQYSSSNMFSASMSYPSHRRSSSSAMEFDLIQFSSSSTSFESKRHANHPHAVESDESDDDDDAASTVSSDGFDHDHLPAHQIHQNFEEHSPYISDKQVLDEDQEVLRYAVAQHPSLSFRHSQGIAYSTPPMNVPIRVAQGIAFKGNPPIFPSRSGCTEHMVAGIHRRRCSS